MSIENAMIIASPFLEPGRKCKDCNTFFLDGEFSNDDICNECGGELLQDDLGSITISGGGSKAAIMISESEAPNFFNQLDNTLRVNFGISLAAVEGCDVNTAKKIGCRSGYEIKDNNVRKKDNNED